MPVAFCTCLELDVVYALWSGHMDADTRRQNFDNYVNDAYYRPGRPEFIDLSAIISSDFDMQRAQILLHQIKSKGTPDLVHTHRVIFAPGDVPYGCARMFQSLAEALQNGHVEVFRNEQRALQALTLPCDTIADLLNAHTFLPQTRVPPTPT